MCHFKSCFSFQFEARMQRRHSRRDLRQLDDSGGDRERRLLRRRVVSKPDPVRLSRVRIEVDPSEKGPIELCLMFYSFLCNILNKCPGNFLDLFSRKPRPDNFFDSFFLSCSHLFITCMNAGFEPATFSFCISPA